jgi:hypothetical protein
MVGHLEVFSEGLLGAGFVVPRTGRVDAIVGLTVYVEAQVLEVIEVAGYVPLKA